MLMSIADAVPYAYITNYGSNNVYVIDTATNNVTAKVNVGIDPNWIAVTPDGSKVYISNRNSNNVFAIDTVTNNVTAKVNVGSGPVELRSSPDGS